jgi:hypothetical protein
LDCLEKVLASDEFVGSAQLSRFLRYVVENGITGGGASLKESVIGVAVFHRGATYDPKVDPIVRVEARRLRGRLGDYYLGAGALDPVRISLPKGGYAPSFDFASTPERRPIDAVTASAAPVARRNWLAWALLSAVCVLACMAAAVALWMRSEPQRSASRFWASLLEGERPALIIPADSGLVMLENLSHRSVTLQEYLTGEYQRRVASQHGRDDELASSLGRRRYTSIADLDFTSRLAGRRDAAARGITIRYARDVRVEDLKGRNVILLGARQSNPWVELFEKDSTFRIDDDETSTGLSIVNLRPAAGEAGRINVSPTDMQTEIYGIVTYHRHESDAGLSLLAAGTSVAGTEAAADFVLDDRRLVPWLRKAEEHGEYRGFDILLSGRNLAGSAPRAEVVSFHVER